MQIAKIINGQFCNLNAFHMIEHVAAVYYSSKCSNCPQYTYPDTGGHMIPWKTKGWFFIFIFHAWGTWYIFGAWDRSSLFLQGQVLYSVLTQEGEDNGSLHEWKLNKNWVLGCVAHAQLWALSAHFGDQLQLQQVLSPVAGDSLLVPPTRLYTHIMAKHKLAWSIWPTERNDTEPSEAVQITPRLPTVTALTWKAQHCGWENNSLPKSTLGQYTQ